jgi:hypothetical protein
MRRVRILTFVVIMLVFAVGQAQVTGGHKNSPPNNQKVYDRFDGKWLDAEKWQSTNPQCWGVLECVREIQNGKLRLAVRNTGRTDTDSGVQWSESEVYFIDPNAVTSIQADVTLRSFSGIGCATNNTDLTHTQVMIGGNFFNSGSGNPNDDVTAWLITWVDISNPQIMLLSVWWGYGDQGWDYGFASYPFGTPLTVALKWDKTNHQFLGSAKVKGDPGPGAAIAVPYSVADTTPPVNAMKNLNAEAHTLNCTSGKTAGQVEATYDNVITNP